MGRQAGRRRRCYGGAKGVNTQLGRVGGWPAGDLASPPHPNPYLPIVLKPLHLREKALAAR